MEQECRELHFGGRCTRRDGHDGRHMFKGADGLGHEWWAGLNGRTHWEDIRDNRVYASGTEQTPGTCGDVFDGEEGKRTCDRPKHHAGPHSRGEGINAYEWPTLHPAISLTEAVQAARREAQRRSERLAEQIYNGDKMPVSISTPFDGGNLRTFTRIRSNEPKEGYIEDHLYRGYCESDETLRARISKTIGVPVTGIDPVDGASGFEHDAGPYITGKPDQSLNGQTPIGDTGASSSHAIDIRFEMIPREFLEALGARFHHGLKHGRFNYRKGLMDKQFVLDRVAHMYEHMGRLFQPMGNDEESFLDNIGAIGWGLCFLCEAYAYPDGQKIIEEMMRPAPGSVPKITGRYGK
jgi:hypothetical protein